MSPKNRAIGKAALTKAALTTLERLISEGIEDAHEAEITDASGKTGTILYGSATILGSLNDPA